MGETAPPAAGRAAADPASRGAVGAPLKVAVVGAGACGPETGRRAFAVGRGLALGGATLLCGGRGGVMERAAAGARSVGGTTIGILPGTGPRDTPPNPSIAIDLYTGLGQGRNLVLVLSAQAVVAIGGGWGTLSEIALALKHRRPVVGLGSWRLEPPPPAGDDGVARADDSRLHEAGSAAEAVARALALAGEGAV